MQHCCTHYQQNSILDERMTIMGTCNMVKRIYSGSRNSDRRDVTRHPPLGEKLAHSVVPGHLLASHNETDRF